MKTKLTLSVEKDVIEEAKLLAKENGSNLSAMVEKYLKELIEEKRYSAMLAETEAIYEKKHSPEIQKKLNSFKKLVGIFKDVPKEKSYDELKWEYFREKYNLEDK